MSIRLLSWAFEQDLPCAEKFVLVALADMADMDGKCWPSQDCLAKRCGIVRETVNRQIKMLVNAGLLRVETRTNCHGKQSSLYFVRCDAGSHPDVTQDHTVSSVRDAGSHRYVTQDHIEPSREPSREDSVAYATAAEAAPIDPVKDLWTRGAKALGDCPASRSLIGKMRNEHGDLAVMDAILACESTAPSDPVAYLRACLRGKAKGNGRRSPVEKLYAGFAEAAGGLRLGGEADEPLLDGRRPRGYP